MTVGELIEALHDWAWTANVDIRLPDGEEVCITSIEESAEGGNPVIAFEEE